MTEARTNIFTRDDTFFGICQAIGEDFRIPPNLLRVALALALFWNPLGAVAVYVGAGILVAFSRWMVPGSTAPAADPRSAGAPAETVDEGGTDEEMAIAA